jgi:hypothetical protein
MGRSGTPVERLDCKTPIPWLASSKILTPPHPPHRPASVYPPLLVRGEDTLAGWRGGWGVNILEVARHSSVLYVCKYFVGTPLANVPELIFCMVEGRGGEEWYSSRTRT